MADGHGSRGFAGLYDLEVRAAGGRSYYALVRVLPSLLSFERYKKMLSDISQIAAHLAIQIQGRLARRLFHELANGLTLHCVNMSWCVD